MKRIYSFHDTSIIIRFENAPGIAGLWHRVLNMLEAYGFKVGRDPRIEKHYASLGPDRRTGNFGDLHFDSERHDQSRWNHAAQGGYAKFEFYQEIVRVNPNGGKYDFDKLEKMPYLIRLRFLHARRAIVAMLDAEGVADESKPVLSTLPALEQVRLKAPEWHCRVDPITEWQPEDRSGCNSRDMDGNRLRPGETRYFYHYTGHLMRGQVYYSLNMMWYVVIGPREIACHAASEFFAWRPGLARRKGRDPLRKLERKLKDAVESQDFERAILYRDLLKRHPNKQAA